MKKLLFSLIITFLLSSCGGTAMRTMFGTTEKNLIKTVAIEQNCSSEQIEIKEKIKGLHGATYSLEACGKHLVYKQVGTVFMEASKADKTVSEISK